MLSPSGSDGNPGTASQPRRTLPALKSGDTVYFRGGTYPRFQLDWTNITGVRIQNYPGESPILDGEYRTGDFANFRAGVSGIVISGLTVTRYADAYGNGSINIVDNASNITIEGNVFNANGLDTNLDHHIYLGGGSASGRPSNIVIRNNFFLNPAAASIHSFGGNNAVNVTIENNRLVGGKWGILISNEGETNWRIANNSFSGITDTAILVADYVKSSQATVSGISIVRNIISVPSGAFALRIDKPQVRARSVSEDGNLFWAGGGPVILWDYPGVGTSLSLAAYQAASGMGKTSVSFDPNFTDSSLRLPASSPVGSWGAR